jgi:hypothetical protein
MNGHLLRSRAFGNPHVRRSTLRLPHALRPCIWPSLNGLQRQNYSCAHSKIDWTAP